MTLKDAFDYATVAFGLVSAVLWWLSARVKFPFGFDNDNALDKAMSCASKLNAWAATFSAFAVGVPAIKSILASRGLL